MKWKNWSKELMDVIGLKKEPVSITYTDSVNFEVSKKKVWVCGAIGKASAGEVIDLTKENSGCGGGSQYLGLGGFRPEDMKTLREFLIDGEKLYACPSAIHRSMAMAKIKPPMGMAEHIIFAPLSKAELKPDVVIFICNAWQAARLVHLTTFETGLPMECDPSGSLCRSVITYPLVTGKVNISFGDITARKMVRLSEDELFVTLPYIQLQSSMEAIPFCTAGTAKGRIPEAMRELMKRSGGEVPELY